MSTLSKKVEKLREDIENLECIVFILSGEMSKSLCADGETINDKLSCFDDVGKDVDNIIKGILSEHGSEECPRSEYDNFL